MQLTTVLLINGEPQDNITITPPVGLYKLKHYLEQRGVVCDVFMPDLDAEEEYLERTRNGEYSVVGISCSHWSMCKDLDRLWRFREAAGKCAQPVIFAAGGQEASQNYDQWLNNGVDVIFLGFAERNFYDFCSRLSAAALGTKFHQLLSEVDGVVFRDNAGGTIFKPTATLTAEFFEEITYSDYSGNLGLSECN